LLLYNSNNIAALPSQRTQRALFSHLNADASTPEIVKALQDDGCVVIKSMIPSTQISHLNDDMNEALSQVTPGKPANVLDEPLPAGMDAAVFGQNTKRLGDLINRSRTWREDVADNDVLHNVSSQVLKELGDYWLSTAQLIEIGPGTKAQPLHADGAGWWPFWTMGDTWNPEFTLNFLIATTRTTKANGATGVVRDSHKMKFSEMAKDPTFSFWQAPEEKVEQIELDAGDCLILGGRTVHRGGANVTSDEFRRILSCTVISSALTPGEAHPLTLHAELAF